MILRFQSENQDKIKALSIIKEFLKSKGYSIKNDKPEYFRIRISSRLDVNISIKKDDILFNNFPWTWLLFILPEYFFIPLFTKGRKAEKKISKLCLDLLLRNNFDVELIG
ncbi:MAG: hypothetical protein OEW75_11510 [Cyclobacteriaceae bacterium]|nr:hypothetical protein [Cyclobacteriaceae bacterium]